MQKESIFIQPRHIHKTWTSKVLAMFEISKVNWEAAALQSNWFQDGFRCRTDSTRCFMIRNWDIWIDEIDAKERCWFRLQTILMLGWFGFMEMRLLEGAPLLRLLFTYRYIRYVRFKFSRLKLLGDGFRAALDIWKNPCISWISSWVLWHIMTWWDDID